MGYKQELLQKIQNIKNFVKERNENLEEAMKVDRLIKLYEDVAHVENFFGHFNSTKYAVDTFGSVEKQREFMAKNQALFQGNEVPKIHSPNQKAEIEIPNVDFEAVINAIEQNTILDETGLEEIYKKEDPNIRAYNLPMTNLVNNIKADADALFDTDMAAQIKASLDYANGEMVEKMGPNLVDSAIDSNSVVPMIKSVEGFNDFVKSKGLDEHTIVNHNGNFLIISADILAQPGNATVYKPFLKMPVNVPQSYQEKIATLNNMIAEEGLLQEAAGGEAGQKEYGLADYFAKQRTLKKALTDHAKLKTEEEKRQSLTNIDRLAKETQEISARYDRVFNYIKENFDLDNISLNGNIYSGRPSQVENGDLENWYPNLPPRYDFENAKAAVFLSGFTQLKAACQQGNVTVEEYLADPAKAYLKAAENIGNQEDQKYFIPRGQENPLGKRIARAIAHPADAYNTLSGYGLVGGRGMEFVTNTIPDKENQVNNTIVTNIVKEYNVLYNHHPDRLFGNQFEPDIASIKNLFALGDQEDNLYKLSNSYRDKEGNLIPGGGPAYDQALKSNVPLDQKYQNLMTTFKDFVLERKYMDDHLDQFAGRDRDGDLAELNSHSLATMLVAGREYFEDYMLANNLSIASIQDDALREEVTSFMIDPVGTVMNKYVKADDLATESYGEVKHNFRAVYSGLHSEESQDFFQKFNQFNQKPNGYNTGKTFTKCLDDNKGSWWERFRKKTSKQYNTLQRIAREAARENGNIPGDNKALYSAAIAYKNYKMPEGGRTFNQLNSTEKRRIEFCDSIIEAYQAQKREAEAQREANQVQAENNQPVQDNNVQVDFQNQLNQDLDPIPNANNNEEVEVKKASEKDPPEEGVQP